MGQDKRSESDMFLHVWQKLVEGLFYLMALAIF
jgi:hypothetical protein